MNTMLALEFEGGQAPFAGCLVHRAWVSARLGEIFEVSLTVLSTDPAIDPQTVVGKNATLTLAGEPFVDRIPGMVRSMRQLSSLDATGGKAASYYEVVLVPPLFLASLRSGRRIHQNEDAVGMLKSTLAPYLSSMEQPVVKTSREHPPREYCVQYDESDLDFILRVLGEEHVTAYFDVRQRGVLTLVDDTQSLTDALPFRLPYKAGSGLVPTGPSAIGVRLEDGYGAGAVDLRDYDFENPILSRAAPPALVGKSKLGDSNQSAKAFSDEASLSSERFEVGRFADFVTGDDIAARDLRALRGGCRKVVCETNVAVFPGTRIFVDDHPRPELREELLVIGCRMIFDDGDFDGAAGQATTGAGQAGGRRVRRSISLECVSAKTGFVPRRRPKPVAVSPETAFVVGALKEGQIDVDAYGRVEVEFVWDRRDQRQGTPTRRVRVSQGWAGTNRGFVTLPRIGDEVLIGYHGGDPDQPIVVGRVHNAVSRTPLDLPDPDKTVSVWKSRTVGGDGFNQILMDDKPSEERLEIRAERDRTDLTQGDSKSTVLGTHDRKIKGKTKIEVNAATEVKVDGPLDIHTTDTTYDGHTLQVDTDDSIRLTADNALSLGSNHVWIGNQAASIEIDGGVIKIKADSISIKGGMVTIAASALLDATGAIVTIN